MSKLPFSIICRRLMHALFIPFVTLLFAASSLTIANAASAGGSQVNCVTQGDGDLYGKGVRIGLYLQWLSTFLLRQLGSWELKERLRTGTNIICGAIMLTAALSILNDRASTIDYLLVYYLTVVLFLSDSFRMNRGAPDIAEIVQPAIFAAFSFFGGWFWLKGIDRLQATTCEEKVAIIWVFNMRGKWTVAASMLSIFAGMAACSISGTSAKQSHLGGFLAPFFPAIEIASDQAVYLSEVLRYGIFWSDRDTNPILLKVDAMPDNESFVQVIRRYLNNDFLISKKCCNAFFRINISSAEERKRVVHRIYPKVYRTYVSSKYFVLVMFPPLIAITSIERMLRANKVETAPIKTSTGKMLSLLTGIFSLVMAMGEIWEWWRGPSDIFWAGIRRRANPAFTRRPGETFAIILRQLHSPQWLIALLYGRQANHGPGP